MKKKLSIFFLFTLFFLTSGIVNASSVGWIDTERFGYTGTITRYSDDRLTNLVETIEIGDRDLCIWSDSAYPASVIMGSWWYSTAVDVDGNPLGSGWGNTTGNTGAGFIQYYDMSQTYIISQDYGFSDFDGSFWTTFSFGLEVENAPYDPAYSRLSAPSNTGDSGTFLSMAIDLTATGLQGVQSNGWIVAQESDAYPTDVTGKLTGVFQNTSSTTANNGYYVFDFDLNMTNWAYENRDDLVGDYDTFYEGSYGAAVPEPTTMLLFGLGILGIAGVSRKRTA